MGKGSVPETLCSFYGKSTQSRRSAGRVPPRKGWVERGRAKERERKVRGEEGDSRRWQPRARRRCSPKLVDNGTMDP